MTGKLRSIEGGWSMYLWNLNWKNCFECRFLEFKISGTIVKLIKVWRNSRKDFRVGKKGESETLKRLQAAYFMEELFRDTREFGLIEA